MSGAAPRPRLRYVETTPQALGFPCESGMTVHQIHLEEVDTLDEAVDVYRGVFGLAGTAGVTVTSRPGRTTIGIGRGDPTLLTLPGDPRVLSADMVLHR